MNQFSITINHLFDRDEDCVRAGFESQIIYIIPRKRVKDVAAFEELNNPGIYLLLGDHGVYVGQADVRENGKGLLGRITETHSNPIIDDWNIAYAITSEMQYMNGPTQLNWLERNFYVTAGKTGRYNVLNVKQPHGAKPDFQTELKLMTYMDNCLWMLKKYLGCDIFVKGKKPAGNKTGGKIKDKEPYKPHMTELFTLIAGNSGAEATAEIIDGKKTVVKAGAVVSMENHLANQKGQGGNDKLRKKLESDGTIVDGKFTKDYTFSSTSAAAAVIRGSASQGPERWVKGGKKLSEIMEKT